jgi:hypothetical protein
MDAVLCLRVQVQMQLLHCASAASALAHLAWLRGCWAAAARECGCTDALLLCWPLLLHHLLAVACLQWHLQ